MVDNIHIRIISKELFINTKHLILKELVKALDDDFDLKEDFLIEINCGEFWIVIQLSKDEEKEPILKLVSNE